MAGSRGGRAVVIGGSMSGLLSALQLRRAGWDVDVYERVESELSGRGAGIVAQYELIDRLRGLGLRDRRTRRRYHHPQNSRQTRDASPPNIECPQVLTAWERVYRLLRDAFPAEHYHRGRGLGEVHARCACGHRAFFRW